MDDGLSVLPIAQASVLRWVLMGGNINESIFWHGLTGCVLVLVRQCRVSFVGCGGVRNALGRGLCGLCLAHCWVLRQQDLFAAMQGGIFWCFFCSCFRYHRSLFSGSAPFVGVWVVVSGGLVDGVVV